MGKTAATPAATAPSHAGRCCIRIFATTWNVADPNTPSPLVGNFDLKVVLKLACANERLQWNHLATIRVT